MVASDVQNRPVTDVTRSVRTVRIMVRRVGILNTGTSSRIGQNGIAWDFGVLFGVLLQAQVIGQNLDSRIGSVWPEIAAGEAGGPGKKKCMRKNSYTQLLASTQHFRIKLVMVYLKF